MDSETTSALANAVVHGFGTGGCFVGLYVGFYRRRIIHCIPFANYTLLIGSVVYYQVVIATCQFINRLIGWG